MGGGAAAESPFPGFFASEGGDVEGGAAPLCLHKEAVVTTGPPRPGAEADAGHASVALAAADLLDTRSLNRNIDELAIDPLHNAAGGAWLCSGVHGVIGW